MKNKLVTVLFFVLAAFVTTEAQRFALVDVNKVLESLDDYKKAQDELDRVAAGWKQEIAIEYDKIKALYNKYQAEQVLLTDEQRKSKEEEITNKEKEVRKIQKINSEKKVNSSAKDKTSFVQFKTKYMPLFKNMQHQEISKRSLICLVQLE